MRKRRSNFAVKTMKVELLISTLLFLALQVTSKESPQYICQDGNYIDTNKMCDGLTDCPDGSDETRLLCNPIICPTNKFRCRYGACINMTWECDGIKQCLDGSDEDQCGSKQVGSCEKNQFKCLSGECLPFKKICDGKQDCKDGTDESEDTCEISTCPIDTYRCKYGGCIHLKQRCDGHQNCIDGTDEIECNAQLSKSLQTYCSPITTSRINVQCEVRSGPKKGMVPCDKPLPVGTIASYECKPYYIPVSSKHKNNRKMICQSNGIWNREELKCKPDCGVTHRNNIPLITHAMPIEAGVAPWHVVLFSLDSGKWVFTCGGTLITEKVVVTAAHCTWNVITDNLKVATGKYYSDYYKAEDSAQIRDVAQIVRHPLYQDFLGNFESDIAIIIMKESIQFSPYAIPACIDWNLNDILFHLNNASLGFIVGMGVTEKDTFSDKLVSTYLPVVDDEQCILKQKRDFKKYITFSSFCAGWANGTGVCNGDSGGGLLFTTGDSPKRWTLQGVVSISPRRPNTDLCDPQYYTIFTKVGLYVKWIFETLQDVHDDAIDPFMRGLQS